MKNQSANAKKSTSTAENFAVLVENSAVLADFQTKPDEKAEGGIGEKEKPPFRNGKGGCMF
ncbi:MAG: hypothetical protein IKU63_09120 [Bacteroidaceae bacterium]|nr:hypothetical protein [Bacteroidaceae bacterium]